MKVVDQGSEIYVIFELDNNLTSMAGGCGTIAKPNLMRKFMSCCKPKEGMRRNLKRIVKQPSYRNN
jgi:hypothetical protein